MKTKLYLFITGLIFSLTGCSHNVGSDPGPSDIVMTQKSLQLVNADNTFTFNLIKKIPDNSGHNVMVSPLSISLALSMTLNGADGDTKSAIINTLGLSALNVEEINQVYFELVSALKKADPKVILNIANSIWIKKNYPVLAPFIATNQKYYDATVELIDFDQTALGKINGWVNQKTNAKIPKILDQISADEIMFLINAIYFKGMWQVQFEKSRTENETFTPGNATTVNVPFMKIKDQFAYSVQTGYKALRMPYGRGKFGMVILLPDEGVTADQLLTEMSPLSWQALNAALDHLTKVDVWMPRFKFSWESTLNEILSSLGMAVAFNKNDANFSKINVTDQLFITKVKHKTFIEVNEEGTEAGAATSVGIGLTSVGPGEPQFHLNRPFLFLITESDTGAILFVGKVESPALTE